MRNTISHGSADQMLDAFEQRIAILEDDQNLEVDSATAVQASRRSGFARGTADQMLDAFERKIDDLEDRDVNSSTSVQASIRRNKKHVEVISDAPVSSDYISTLVDAVNNELEDLNVFDSWTWDEEKDSMVLTTILDNDVQEYTIPKEDLKFNEAGLDRDVEYIMNAITSEDDPGDVTSCTSVQASSKAVSIPDHATDTYYKDVGGEFGEIDAIYSLEDIMIMWNSECNSDPTMSQYASFNDWWQDTKQWMKPSSKPAGEADDEMFTDNDGVFGNPGDIISKRDMRAYYEENCDSDPSLMDYNSFEDWWSDTESYLTTVESATSSDKWPNIEVGDIIRFIDDPYYGTPKEKDTVEVTKIHPDGRLSGVGTSSGSSYPYLNPDMWEVYRKHSDRSTENHLTSVETSTNAESSDDFAYDWEINGTFEKVASKQVPDSDGFYTDYTMYRDLQTGEYVFVFGDNDYYSPEDGDYDYECETEDEAYEWFDSYTGFDDEDV